MNESSECQLQTGDHYVRGDENIFSLWERGGHRGDSITPATHCLSYRDWMTALLERLLRGSIEMGPVLSLGCGNAFVEGALFRSGHVVCGLDKHKEAVRLAREKGVDARVQDVQAWAPTGDEYGLVLADGIFGHLFDHSVGLARVLGAIYLSLRSGGHLVVSNDPSADGSQSQLHPSVRGFYWFSPEYLVQQMTLKGFAVVEVHTFSYMRPLSGPRDRLIVVGKKLQKMGSGPG